ncbi:hypothetical protein BH09PLA1_BH09PLA1_16030 [soil metagenome]
MRKLIALSLLLCFVATTVGCKATAKAGDGEAGVKVEKT